MEEWSQSSNDVPYRRRGRPSGKNRIPLSIDERRARNAQYERQRRYETAEALAQLTEASGCDPTISNADMLATVISQLQRAAEHPSKDIEELRRSNQKLIRQVEALEERLSNWEDNHIPTDRQVQQRPERKRKREPSESGNSKLRRTSAADLLRSLENTPPSESFSNDPIPDTSLLDNENIDFQFNYDLPSTDSSDDENNYDILGKNT